MNQDFVFLNNLSLYELVRRNYIETHPFLHSNQTSDVTVMLTDSQDNIDTYKYTEISMNRRE